MHHALVRYQFTRPHGRAPVPASPPPSGNPSELPRRSQTLQRAEDRVSSSPIQDFRQSFFAAIKDYSNGKSSRTDVVWRLVRLTHASKKNLVDLTRNSSPIASPCTLACSVKWRGSPQRPPSSMRIVGAKKQALKERLRQQLQHFKLLENDRGRKMKKPSDRQKRRSWMRPLSLSRHQPHSSIARKLCSRYGKTSNGGLYMTHDGQSSRIHLGRRHRQRLRRPQYGLSRVETGPTLETNMSKPCSSFIRIESRSSISTGTISRKRSSRFQAAMTASFNTTDGSAPGRRV
ncbi:hypothetical protein BGW80DRAFT_225380 [Lactifluus volemus]|nr:hypothetical protein BGW80DRAFT_225380 [Lactifluus volemus]